jgi:hypothetical protein
MVPLGTPCATFEIEGHSVSDLELSAADAVDGAA